MKALKQVFFKLDTSLSKIKKNNLNLNLNLNQNENENIPGKQIKMFVKDNGKEKEKEKEKGKENENNAEDINDINIKVEDLPSQEGKDLKQKDMSKGNVKDKTHKFDEFETSKVNNGNFKYLPWDEDKELVLMDEYIKLLQIVNIERPTFYLRSKKENFLCPKQNIKIPFLQLEAIIERKEIEAIKKNIDSKIKCICCFKF